MSALPFLPDPGEIGGELDPIVVAQLGAQVVAWAATVDDAPVVIDTWHRWSAIAEYISKHGVAGRRDAQAAARRLEVRIGQVNTRPGAGRPRKDGNSPRAANFDHRRAGEFESMAEHEDTVEKVIDGSTDEDPPYRRVVLRAIDRDIRQRVDATARFIDEHLDVDDERGDRWWMIAGKISDRLDAIPNGSIDIIVTDPPYPAEFHHLWGELAEHAKRLLVPQGIIVALSGKIHLPAVMSSLGEHLSYGWIYCERLTGASSRILARHVGQEWKPWLAYSNGEWPSGRVDWHPDVLTDAKQAKEIYRWQQAEAPAGELIDTLCPPGGIVLDPFTGSGTYGVAALRAGRRFIGVEPDAHRFAAAVKRISEVTE